LDTALKPIRYGPLIIPYVHATTITPLSTESASIIRGYAVCIRLTAPADAVDEWLDFGLGHVSPPQTTEKGFHGPIRAQIVSASLDGVPVKLRDEYDRKLESACMWGRRGVDLTYVVNEPSSLYDGRCSPWFVHINNCRPIFARCPRLRCLAFVAPLAMLAMSLVGAGTAFTDQCHSPGQCFELVVMQSVGVEHSAGHGPQIKP
jgi:hypothetical protein